MKVGTFIGGNWLDGVPEEAQRAEEIGYDFVSCDESGHDSILTMTLAAANTTQVELETAVTVAFSRSPMVLAMEAWDIQRLSNGRFILGLGTQWKDHLERRLSTPWAPPATRMKEYVQCLRAIWDTFQHGVEPGFIGKWYRFDLMTQAYNPGPIEFPYPKVFVGAARPVMVRVAGEIADGIPSVRVTDKYMREVILPNIKVGLERVGRSWSDIEITGSGVLVVGDSEAEIEASLTRVRKGMARAFFPGSHVIGPLDEIFELHGWIDLRDRLRALGLEGRLEEMEQVIPGDVLHEFAQTSTYDNLPNFIQKHREYAKRIHFSMPLRNEHERERFQQILKQIQQIETPGVPVGLEIKNI